MRNLVLGLALIAIGCNVVPAAITPPQDMTVVIGGLSDSRPYFGTYKLAGSSGSDLAPAGNFMLASCGCGEWRVLFQPSDGSPQRQLTVSFYVYGDYKPTGVVTVYGPSDDETVMATVDQDNGLVTGHSQKSWVHQEFAGVRSSAHEQAVDACIMCHLGDDPIWPLPPQHPPKYKTNPRVCLECHSVNGQ